MSTTTDQVAAITRFFARWGESSEAVQAAFAEAFAAEGEWIAGPPPIPPVTGAAGCQALMAGFKQSHDLETIDVEILNIGQSGDTVYSERIDHLIDSAGKRFISLPVAGVMKLDGEGRITYWRDYWDMTEFNALNA